jgi:hypothetical protein
VKGRSTGDAWTANGKQVESVVKVACYQITYDGGSGYGDGGRSGSEWWERDDGERRIEWELTICRADQRQLCESENRRLCMASECETDAGDWWPEERSLQASGGS